MANDEMIQGYRDGRNLENPEPNDNRSHSYRHGFKAGRSDVTHTLQFPSVQAAIEMANEAVSKDASA
mgnify:CR=1 FL=1